jgi:hypothetical protein
LFFQFNNTFVTRRQRGRKRGVDAGDDKGATIPPTRIVSNALALISEFTKPAEILE